MQKFSNGYVENRAERTICDGIHRYDSSSRNVLFEVFFGSQSAHAPKRANLYAARILFSGVVLVSWSQLQDSSRLKFIDLETPDFDLDAFHVPRSQSWKMRRKVCCIDFSWWHYELKQKK